MFFDQRWDEADWRNECAAAERDERRREAADMADWHSGDSAELTAFLDETTPDAPGGRYVMESESDIEQARRLEPMTAASEFYRKLAVDLLKEVA